MIKSVMAVALAVMAVSAAEPTEPAGGPVWLSDENLARPVVGQKPGGMSHGAPEGVRPIKLWPLFEDERVSIRCIGEADGTIHAFDPAMAPIAAETATKRGCASIAFPAGRPGVYTLFYTTKTLTGSVLTEHTAKFEKAVGRHGDKPVEGPGTVETPETVAFDLIRIKEDEEGLFHRFYSGDRLDFRVLLDGQPLKGADVVLKTGSGWVKRIRTGSDGSAAFQLIKEYFPEWGDFDKRHEDRFVVTAAYTRDATGEYGGAPYTQQRYSVTVTDNFYPEPAAYRSYAFALGIGTAALLLTGVFVYLYRRRRHQPFKEVTFDEKA